jgi:hypothetical protein
VSDVAEGDDTRGCSETSIGYVATDTGAGVRFSRLLFVLVLGVTTTLSVALFIDTDIDANTNKIKVCLLTLMH